jgi:hypothetical protein
MSPPDKQRSPARGPRQQVAATTTRTRYTAALTPAAKDVADHIAKILGADGDRTVPRPVRQFDSVRSAALAIIEANLPLEDEVALLGRLKDAAKDAEVPELAVAAIIEEVAPEDVAPVHPTSVATAARSLRRAGYSRCPVCYLTVTDERVIHQWEAETDERRAQDERSRARRDHLRRLGGEAS